MVSKYTMEVRYICEQLANATIETQAGDVPGIIEKAAPQIFDFDFPIWNEDYRKTLEEKILLHFYMREIGQETVGEWKWRLMQTLQDIMPEINELYKSVEFKYDPLTDIDYTTDTEGDTEVNSTRNTNVTEGIQRNETENTEDSGTNTETSNSDNKQTFSDTPQGNLENVWNGTYLTTANRNVGDNTTTNTNKAKRDTTRGASVDSTGTGSEAGNDKTARTLVSRVYGKSSFRSYGRLIQEFRENIMNVDKLVFEKLECCFMLLY